MAVSISFATIALPAMTLIIQAHTFKPLFLYNHLFISHQDQFAERSVTTQQ